MNNSKMIEALAVELSKLGWNATSDNGWLRVEGRQSLRTPETRGERYVWGGYSAKSPSTMARRLDAFLRGA